jgi:hypothetical protein
MVAIIEEFYSCPHEKNHSVGPEWRPWQQRKIGFQKYLNNRIELI